MEIKKYTYDLVSFPNCTLTIPYRFVRAVFNDVVLHIMGQDTEWCPYDLVIERLKFLSISEAEYNRQCASCTEEINHDAEDVHHERSNVVKEGIKASVKEMQNDMTAGTLAQDR